MEAVEVPRGAQRSEPVGGTVIARGEPTIVERVTSPRRYRSCPRARVAPEGCRCARELLARPFAAAAALPVQQRDWGSDMHGHQPASVQLEGSTVWSGCALFFWKSNLLLSGYVLKKKRQRPDYIQRFKFVEDTYIDTIPFYFTH